MDDIIELTKAIEEDQKGEGRIARVTIQPWLWQELGKAGGTFTTYAGSQLLEIPGRPIIRYDILGVPMEIDEIQTESYRLWDANNEELSNR